MNNPEQMQFPIMAFKATPYGMEVTILFSNLIKQSFLIPEANSDQLAIEWLSRRPKEVLDALKVAVRQAISERETLQAAVANPTRLPIALTRGIKG